MKKTEMQWKEIISTGNQVKDIVIDIEYIYTNMRPNIIKVNYTVEQNNTNYKIKKIFTNTIKNASKLYINFEAP